MTRKSFTGRNSGLQLEAHAFVCNTLARVGKSISFDIRKYAGQDLGCGDENVMEFSTTLDEWEPFLPAFYNHETRQLYLVEASAFSDLEEDEFDDENFTCTDLPGKLVYAHDLYAYNDLVFADLLMELYPEETKLLEDPIVNVLLSDSKGTLQAFICKRSEVYHESRKTFHGLPADIRDDVALMDFVKSAGGSVDITYFTPEDIEEMKEMLGMQEKEKKTAKIVVIVKGGNVQDIYSNTTKILNMVIDHDLVPEEGAESIGTGWYKPDISMSDDDLDEFITSELAKG